METRLIEFSNGKGNILRGIFLDTKSKKGVIFLHGFKRNSSAEPKFKNLSDALAKKGVSSFRFDYTGTGISDGDFSKITVKTMLEDLEKAIDIFKKESKIEEFSFVAHSLSGCVVAEYLSRKKDLPNKIVLLAPALNQKDLLRYYFAINSNKAVEIAWHNYEGNFDEEDFLKDAKRDDKTAKAHYIKSDYPLENLDKDYSKNFMNYEDVLLVHGDKDIKVPLKSLNFDFSNKIIVKDGDHDIEKPSSVDQWLEKVVDYLSH